MRRYDSRACRSRRCGIYTGCLLSGSIVAERQDIASNLQSLNSDGPSTVRHVPGKLSVVIAPFSSAVLPSSSDFDSPTMLLLRPTVYILILKVDSRNGHRVRVRSGEIIAILGNTNQ